MLEALGFTLFSAPVPAIGIPPQKMADILFECQRALRLNEISYADLESLVGKMGHVALAIAGARAFISSLRFLLSSHKANKTASIVLSSGAKTDLAFFAHAMAGTPLRIIIPSEVSIPLGHVMKDAATGTVTEAGHIAVALCGLTLVFSPPGRINLQIADLELIAETLASFMAAAL